jgi:hypothetical protein
MKCYCAAGWWRLLGIQLFFAFFFGFFLFLKTTISNGSCYQPSITIDISPRVKKTSGGEGYEPTVMAYL